MMRFAVLSAVFTGLRILVAIGALIAILVSARGRARTFGAAGVALTLLALLPQPLAGVFQAGVGEFGFLALQGLANLLNLAGFVLLIVAVIVGSRGSTPGRETSGDGWHPPQQDFGPPQGFGQQNPQ